MPKLTPDKLDNLRKTLTEGKKQWIKVGMSTCGIAAGADQAMDTLKQEAQKHGLKIAIEKCGCSGMCFAEPLVEVSIEGMPTVTYGKVDSDTAVDIINRHVCGKKLLNGHIFKAKRD